MIATDTPTLTAELAEVAARRTDWALNFSDAAAVWINKRTPPLVTLRAATPEKADHAIAEWEHRHPRLWLVTA